MPQDLTIPERLRDGVPPSEILRECTNADERAAAFEAMCMTPNHEAMKATRKHHAILTTFYAVLVFLYLVGVADALIVRESVVEPLVGLVGNCAVVMGLRRRRLWVYVGIPLWSGLMAVGELRAFNWPGSEVMLGGALLLGITVVMLAVAAAVATWLRLRLFPYSSWRGVRRHPDGSIIVPDELWG